MLIDTHCHLDFADFESDRDNILVRAREAGVNQFIAINTRVSHFPALLDLAQNHQNVWCSVGTHPHNAADEAERAYAAEHIADLAKHARVVAIGEAGLDYHYDYAPHDVQKEMFAKHIEAARLSQLPLVIHARACDADMADMLTHEMNRAPFQAVMHCYSSGIDLARTALDLGLYISFSGIVTFKNAKGLQDIARTVPGNRILVETDAPYLAPVPQRGQRNEPAFVVHTAQFLADLRGIPLDKFAQQTTANACALFHKLTP